MGKNWENHLLVTIQHDCTFPYATMKLHILLTLSWAVSCLASSSTGPYECKLTFFSLCLPMLLKPNSGTDNEAIYIWYGYQMEVQLYGAGNTKILSSCRGSGAGGSCQFDEFLRALDGNAKDERWGGSTDVGAATDLDVESVVKKLADTKYSAVYNLKTIMPGVITPPSSRRFRLTMPQIILPIADRIKEVRRDATARGVNFAAYVDKMKLSLDRVREYRLAEQATGSIPNLQEYLENNRKITGYQLVFKDPPETLSDGTPYKSIDWEQSFDKNKELHDKVLRGDLLQAMKDFVNGELKLTTKGNKSQVTHQAAIRAIEECIEHLNVNC